jgi:DNA processing protein
MHPDTELLELAHRLLYRPGRVAALCAGPGGPRDWLPLLRREEALMDLPSAASLALQTSLCRGLDIRCAAWGGADYPPALTVLREPPPLLFYRGRLPVPGDTPLAVVGSRRASRGGLEMARRLGRAAAAAGHPVVSGLARGIDQAAQRGSLEEGVTWGVLGCGLDQIYPPEAGRLAQEVIERGGLISEFPPGCPPLPFHFPRRNRIIAALGEGLLVVEAGLRSGALRTAQECRDLGRELGAVPGSPVNPSAAGSNQLLAEGCQLILGPEDLPLLWGAEREALAAASGDWSPERCAREGVNRIELLSARSGWLLTETLSAVADWERQGRVERLPGGAFRVLGGEGEAEIAKGTGAG